tara:strand:+ start:1717 stop:1854 length:138 start_codon:yes stop_codon:yes gene_type:complete
MVKSNYEYGYIDNAIIEIFILYVMFDVHIRLSMNEDNLIKGLEVL